MKQYNSENISEHDFALSASIFLSEDNKQYVKQCFAFSNYLLISGCSLCNKIKQAMSAWKQFLS